MLSGHVPYTQGRTSQPARKKGPGRLSGVTLIELIVVSGISTLLMSGVLSALLSSGRLMSWVGTRSDINSSALMGLSVLSSDLRASAYRTLTIINHPTALSFCQEDPTTSTMNAFVPGRQFTVYYYAPATRTLMRKVWSDTQTDPLAPATLVPARLEPDLLRACIQQTNGTERPVATSVTAATCVPDSFPCSALVRGIQVSLALQKDLSGGQTCVQTVATMVIPRNHP